MNADLSFVRKWPDVCTEETTRQGELQPCEKPAVAVRIDPNEGTPYPVCAFHSRAVMVPLADVLGGGSVPGEPR